MSWSPFDNAPPTALAHPAAHVHTERPLAPVQQRNLAFLAEEDPGPIFLHDETIVEADKVEVKDGYGIGSLLLAGVVGGAAGFLGGLYIAKQTVAKGAGVLELAGRVRKEGGIKAHPSFFKIVRDPESGQLMRVNGQDVVAQLGPVFAYYDSDESVYRAANLRTGQRWKKTYPSQDALEAEFSTEIVPALDR